MPGRILRVAVVAALLASLSCSDAGILGPDVRSPADLRLLHVAPGTPPLASSQASVWVVKGRAGALDLYYRPLPGHTDSLKFLEFRLGAEALDRRPDGTPIAPGDSVLISVQVTDARHLVIDYQPSGLRFAPGALPTLRMYYSFCGDDLNYDRKVDAADDAIADQLAIWQQEGAGQPWYRLSSAVTKSSREVSARVAGFTGYAIMY